MITKTPTFGLFELFGSAHIVTVVVMTVVFVLFNYLCHYDAFKKFYKSALLVSLIVLDIGFRVWAGFYEQPDYVSLFSLHVSSASIILSISLLLKYNQKVFEVLFYWAILFVPQAILTPGLGKYNYPHLRFFHIFLVHLMVIFTVVYFIRVEKKKLRRKHLCHVLIVTQVYGICIFVVNIIFKTNYMFIGRKTDISILRYLGDWPYFVIVLNILMVILFAILNRIYFVVERRNDENY